MPRLSDTGHAVRGLLRRARQQLLERPPTRPDLRAFDDVPCARPPASPPRRE